MARQADWFGMGMETWLLGLETAQVMWLRGGLIALGGVQGEREARRMVEEKVAANTASAGASRPAAPATLQLRSAARR